MRKLWVPSPFYHPRGSYPLDMIVVHHIGSSNKKLYSVNGTVTWFTDENVHKNKNTGVIENKVSAHYIIPREEYKDNDIIHLVHHNDIAYHAGYSQWVVGGKTRKYLNNYSIGIELEGDGNLVEYTDFQYNFLIELIREIMQTHHITDDNIVGHEDVSPGRKVDPGKLFDWKKLRTGVSPTIILMPSTEIIADPVPEPKVEDNVETTVFMDGGENRVGSPNNFFSFLLDTLQKIFK